MNLTLVKMQALNHLALRFSTRYESPTRWFRLLFLPEWVNTLGLKFCLEYTLLRSVLQRSLRYDAHNKILSAALHLEQTILPIRDQYRALQIYCQVLLKSTTYQERH